MAAEIAPLDLSSFFETHPVLETERLLLRPITVDDAQDVFAYGSDPEVTKYMIFPTHRTIEDALAWLRIVPGEFERKERLNFAIMLKASGKFIGSSGFHHFVPQHHNVMLGYVLNRNYWGMGFMTEVVHEMIRFAFEEMGMHRISAHCDKDNVRSALVMERCGMQFEGLLKDNELRRGVFVSTKVYAIVKGN